MIGTRHTGAHSALATDRWAQRLAARMAARQAPSDSTPDQAIAMAVGTLWALFDDVMAEANVALANASRPERIQVRRQPHSRTYLLDTPGALQRHIQISVNVRAAGGQITGGALLAGSQTRACAFMVPSFDTGTARWVVQATGVPLRARIVRDLFLSIFADDPGATRRLSPVSGNEFFGNPWL